MALITRLTRLFRADMHAVLERMEEPDIVLHQAVREMEEELARGTQALSARELDQRQTRVRIAELEATLKRVSSELDLCFEAGNEPLARTQLRRRLESERMARHLGQRDAALEQDIAARRRVLDEQRRQLEDMRQKAALFDAEPREGVRDATSWRSEDFAVSEADVDLALLRERRQRRTP